MRVLEFMPRNMRFGPSNASSIDLCVNDLITASRYRQSTTIVCCENDTLFPDLEIKTYSSEIDASKARKLKFAIGEASKTSADIVVVQQHLPTAAVLARRIAAPVILHKHNMTKPIPADSVMNAVRRQWRLRQYNALAGMIFVSHACRDNFLRDWPEVETPSVVVPNGLDFSQWPPAFERRNEIICVGRAAPEKGIKEAALAVAAVLTPESGWRARFILAEPDRFPQYLQEVRDALEPVASLVDLDFSQPFSFVRERYREAAIALIPSKWDEPFGRTALEAHAGGCAVISSSSGGLREINAGNALELPQPFSASDITEHLKSLMINSESRMSLAQRGRAYCEQQYSLSKVSNTADDFYDRIVHARSASRRAA